MRKALTATRNAALVLTLSVGPLGAQTSNVPDDARPLVVAVRSYATGSTIPQVGAGVVVDVASDSITIATAAHVVFDSDRIWIYFTDQFDSANVATDSVAASMSQISNDLEELDLAVVRIPANPDRVTMLLPRLNRLGQSRTVRNGDDVYPVGCPNGICWTAPSPADQILVASPLELLFQSALVQRGSSGGALFNGYWEVIGIVTDSDPPTARAIPIDLVLAQLRNWQVNVGLRKASFPRAGYKTTVGFTLLSSSRDPGKMPPDGRLPSYRLTVSREVMKGVHLHGGAIRLAPPTLGGACPPPAPVASPSSFTDPAEDLTAALSLRDRAPCEAVLSGLVGGGSLVFQAGRVSVRPFGELVIGASESRLDQGGYYVAESAAPDADVQYVPLYVVGEENRMAIGGGLSLDVVAVPRLIFSVEAGMWQVEKPFSDADLPPGFSAEFPSIYFGLGLRLGL